MIKFISQIRKREVRSNVCPALREEFIREWSLLLAICREIVAVRRKKFSASEFDPFPSRGGGKRKGSYDDRNVGNESE